MGMTKKDYELIATVIKTQMLENDDAKTMGYINEALHGELQQQMCVLIESLSHAFEEKNPMFIQKKFEEACGLAD